MLCSLFTLASSGFKHFINILYIHYLDHILLTLYLRYTWQASMSFFSFWILILFHIYLSLSHFYFTHTSLLYIFSFHCLLYIIIFFLSLVQVFYLYFNFYLYMNIGVLLMGIVSSYLDFSSHTFSCIYSWYCLYM